MPGLHEEESIDIERADDQARVRRQLERILAHSSFRNSRRYQAFLRYVVDERLNGNSVYLKERMIGIAVFQQPLDYDTNANSVVRVTAGEVRRRLAQYYLNASLVDEVMIELPIGSYVPEFRPHDITIAPEATLLTSDLGLLLVAKETSQPTVPVLAELADQRKTQIWTNPWIIAAACGLLAVAVAFVLIPRTAKTSEADRLWQGAFGGSDVLLCVGPLGAEHMPSNGQPHDATPQSKSGISFTTAKTIGIIGSAIGRTGGTTFIAPMQDAKLEDLQRSPAVLIGAFNNEWTLRLQAPLRYQFFRTSEDYGGIIDTKDPSKRFMVNDRPTRDYGILAHFHSPTTGQSTVIAGGLGMHGTAAVRIFLSSPEILKEFSNSAPRGWEKGNYEIVLSSEEVNKLADSPKVVTAYFW